ncbi:MAG: hypothetical protein WD830_05660 [Chloroflexota bacterium]
MKVLLVTNPAADGAFRLVAEHMLDLNGGTPEGLQSRLRDEYPRASVVRGIEDHGSERWYAYRDGSWIGPRSS